MGWAFAALGLVIAAALVVWWRRVALVLPPPAGVRATFVASNDQGNFGELLTAVALTSAGWRQLPSKLGGGGHGIDGLFVRRGLFGHRVLIVETKTNVSPYKPRQLANKTLIRTIGELYLVGQLDRATATALVGALRRRAPSVRKECWRHRLASGWTEVRRARADGGLRRRTQMRDLRGLAESLAMMLAAFDRDGAHIHARN